MSAQTEAVKAQENSEVDPLYQGLGPRGKTLAQGVLQKTLETQLSHKSNRWQDPSGRGSGQVTPLRTFKIDTGHFCREYRETVTTPAGAVSAIRTACRNDAGFWEPVGSEEP